MKLVELLAPAKDYAAAAAAVDYGADAVYIGGARFGARQAAGNSAEEIARVVEYAHRFGVRVHATLNTLVWDDELEAAERQARSLIDAGVDALIVQDMALRRMDLPVELHASTQVSNRTPEGARFLGEAGFARVILERNLTLEEIRAICAATAAEVECFVHGAVCVGYSGRCFLSRSMSARSGNRGVCSQPCRLTWDLTDGKGRTWIAGKHLLSVRDMNLSQRIGDLLDAGVTSFKIEGRLKDLAYIRNVVAHYRRAVDEALALRPGLVRSSVGESVPDFTPDPSKSFTRGESDYFLDGKRAGVASFDTPKAVGERVGRVAGVSGGTFTVDSADDALHANDVTVSGGTLTLASGDDAVHADNDFVVGVQGSSSTSNPKISITASCEGLEGTTVSVYSGDIDVAASDDGVNAANSELGEHSDKFAINIAGGDLYIDAGSDGLDEQRHQHHRRPGRGLRCGRYDGCSHRL